MANKISQILKGTNQQGQFHLDTLMNSIGDNPNILWYPSAGNDYRDILELSRLNTLPYGIPELPDLFIHTDYNPDSLNSEGEVFNDDKTRVQIKNKFELQLKTPINYYVNPAFAAFPEYAPIKPTIYLLDVVIFSNDFGEIRKTVLYFLFENINFLDEIILRNKIQVSHIVKVREGCGYGGNRQSISLVYGLLSVLKTKYILIDKEVNIDFELINQLSITHNLLPHKYDLIFLNSINNWSDFMVNIFSPVYRDQILDLVGLEKILKEIKFS